MSISDKRAPSCTPFIVASPLWSRAPARDENGKPYFDFMMIIPGLKQENQAGLENHVLKIKNSLKAFENVVVYVDLNVKLNLLWVSIKPIPDISRHIMQAIQYAIPAAKVVAGDFNTDCTSTRAAQPLLTRIHRKVTRTLWMSSK